MVDRSDYHSGQRVDSLKLIALGHHDVISGVRSSGWVAVTFIYTFTMKMKTSNCFVIINFAFLSYASTSLVHDHVFRAGTSDTFINRGTDVAFEGLAHHLD